MDIRFVGPLGHVTGSCTWLEHEGVQFLVDCGLEQDARPEGAWNDKSWPFDPSRLRFVVLTHAHADHCGLIPALYQRGFKGPVYCTRETARIATVMLKDSARLSGALHTEADVDAIHWKEPGLPVFGGYHPVAHDLFIRFFRTGHVVGAVAAQILWGDRTAGAQQSIMFSGDLGPDTEDREALPFVRFRMDVPPSDFAVVESTYGSRNRVPWDDGLKARRQQLAGLVDRVMETRGTLLIPAFALGRVQDLLFDLHWLVAHERDRYAALSVQLDAPLARKLAPVLIEAFDRTQPNGKGKVRPLWLGKQIFRWLGLDDTDPQDIDRAVDICHLTMGLPLAHPAVAARGNAVAQSWPNLLAPASNNPDVTSDTGTAGPRIVVATSGMGDHGRAAGWLRALLRDTTTIVAFSGYCAAASVGGHLQALAEIPCSERRRLRGDVVWGDGERIAERDIQASIAALSGYSGHADQAGLVAWVFPQFRGEFTPAARTIFVQHGNEQDRVALVRAIERRAEELGVSVECIRPMPADLTYRLGSLTRVERVPAEVT